MRCQDLQLELESYLCDRLSDAEKHAIEAHLKACEGCRREADELRALFTELHDIAPPPPKLPKNFAQDILKEARKRPSAKLKRRPRARQTSSMPFAAITVAAALLLLLILGWSLTGTKSATSSEKKPKQEPQSKTPEKHQPPTPKHDEAKTPVLPAPEVQPKDTQKSEEPPETKVEPERSPKPSPEPESDPELPPEVIAKKPKPPTIIEPKPEPETKTHTPTVLAARVRRGQEALARPQEQLFSGQKYSVKKGQKGLFIEFENRAAVLLSAGSEFQLEQQSLTLTRGAAIIDARDAKSPIKLNGQCQLPAKARCLIEVDKNGQAQDFAVFDGELVWQSLRLKAGQRASLKNKTWKVKAQGQKREPQWARKARGRWVIVYSLTDDFAEKQRGRSWLTGQTLTLKGRDCLKLVNDNGQFIARRKPVDLMFRYFPEMACELKIFAQRSCTVQLRFFDATRQDNYDLRIKVKAGRLLTKSFKLSQFKAADNSQTPLGVGHVITGLSVLGPKNEQNPGVHVFGWDFLRKS